MDRRVKYTKKVIKETFIALLEEKDIKKITVNHTYPLIHISDLQFHGYMVDFLISTMN